MGALVVSGHGLRRQHDVWRVRRRRGLRLVCRVEQLRERQRERPGLGRIVRLVDLRQRHLVSGARHLRREPRLWELRVDGGLRLVRRVGHLRARHGHRPHGRLVRQRLGVHAGGLPDDGRSLRQRRELRAVRWPERLRLVLGRQLVSFRNERRTQRGPVPWLVLQRPRLSLHRAQLGLQRLHGHRGLWLVLGRRQLPRRRELGRGPRHRLLPRVGLPRHRLRDAVQHPPELRQLQQPQRL